MQKLFMGLAGAVLLAGCMAVEPKEADTAPAEVKQPAVVYFTKDISPEGLVKIYNQISQNVKGKVAIKVHTGEPHGPNIIPPQMVKALQAQIPNSNLVETNTLYEGGRHTTEAHRKTIEINGWTFCPVDIMDEDGTVALPVKDGIVECDPQQDVLYVAQVSPVFYRQYNGVGDTLLPWIGVIISIAALIIESLADKQKSQQKAIYRKARKSALQAGLRALQKKTASILQFRGCQSHIKSHTGDSPQSGPHCGSAVMDMAILPYPFILQFFPRGKILTRGGNKMTQNRTVKKTWYVDTDACTSLEEIARNENRTMTQVINEALRYYADRYYLEHKATMLPNEIMEAMQSTVNMLERRLDNRSSQLLSSMAVQLFIVNRVLADSLDISAEALEQYRSQAAEFIKGNNRLLELREVV